MAAFCAFTFKKAELKFTWCKPCKILWWELKKRVSVLKILRQLWLQGSSDHFSAKPLCKTFFSWHSPPRKSESYHFIISALAVSEGLWFEWIKSSSIIPVFGSMIKYCQLGYRIVYIPLAKPSTCSCLCIYLCFHCVVTPAVSEVVRSLELSRGCWAAEMPPCRMFAKCVIDCVLQRWMIAGWFALCVCGHFAHE